MAEIDDEDAHCSYAGPGRGDCEHFIGLPGKSIPGQHDGSDDTVDVYGKPNGWCWFCWHSLQIQKQHTRGLELAKTLTACMTAMNPPDRDGISMHEWNQGLKSATKEAAAVFDGTVEARR